MRNPKAVIALMSVLLCSCVQQTHELREMQEERDKRNFPCVLLYGNSDGYESLARVRRMDGSTFLIGGLEAGAIAEAYQPGDTIK